ncbi:arginine--tRNA ligase [Candidatus Gracilibacteria bacterium]|nr:arginine--tRNA ligase [Candidatus Gracilibacteria bacterium]
MINTYKQHFAEILSSHLNLPVEEIFSIIEIPPENIPGDLAFPCFRISKQIGKAPNDISQDLSQNLKSDFFSSFQNLGAYINAHINKQKFINDVLSSQIPNSKFPISDSKVIVEYMSANPNKPLHIGQARNICIGDSIRRIYSYCGYDVHSFDYGDDSGVNVGYNLVGHLYYKIPLESDLKFDHYCGEVYAKMRNKEEDLEFKKYLSDLLIQIEEGNDPTINEIHTDYVQKCTIEQFKSCRRMNAHFDVVNRETDILHLKFFAETMDKLRENGYIKYMEEGAAAGCRVIDLSSLPEYANQEKQYQILIKSDGVATYVAKDIAFAMRKLGYLSKDFKYDVFTHAPDGKIIYTTHSQDHDKMKGHFGNYDISITVIDNRQNAAQEVVKSSLKLLGYTNDRKQYLHLPYGVVYLTPQTLLDSGYKLTDEEKSEKRLPFASRKGRTVTIDEMMEILHQKAYRETKERHPEALDIRLDEVSEKLAIGSFRFLLTKTDISKDITFDLREALDMQGESGAYVLYTGARLNKLLSEPAVSSSTNTPLIKGEHRGIGSLLTEDLEFDIIKKLSEFESVVIDAQKDLAPHLICRYLLDLSKLLNSYYANIKILSAPYNIKNARLRLVDQSLEILKKAMNLIGMQFIEKM